MDLNFWAARKDKKWSFALFRPNLCEFRIFHPYFICKYNFREVSMLKMVILDLSEPILLYLKKKSKIQKSEICKLHVYYSEKNANKTRIQPILKSNSTSFIFNNIFCEMKGKKVIHWRAAMGEPSKFLLSSVISVFTWISKYITWISKQ